MAEQRTGDKTILAVLLEALPLIARISGGYASVADREGKRLLTVDSRGKELKEYHGVVYDLAKEASEKNVPVFGYSAFVPESEAWAMPIGDFVLSASNTEKIQREQKFRESLSQALPLIARVAGGEAVLFDQDGRRIESVDPHGDKKADYIGQISKAAQEAMTTQRAVVGKSMSVPGATAVRIPITEKFGFGFNNEMMVSQKHKLIEEVKKFQYARYNFDDIIGNSESIQRTKTVARYVSQGISSVLIFGETGTGKELFAQAIHNASLRSDKPFIAINCGAVPPSLIEGNLFGYVEGSFTGAKKGGSAGIFESANGGTVFLDEISEMEWDLQARLLRVLQEQEVTRLGSSKPIRVNVRIISSTNRNLKRLVEEKKFREDLFYRLNVVELKVPPLKERHDDIQPLTRCFLEKYNRILGRMVEDISAEVLDIFCRHEWPGNVRELQNCIESALNIIEPHEHILQKRHLPSQFEGVSGAARGEGFDLEAILRETEKAVILRVLQEEKESRARVAKRLNISTTTLWRKMVEHGILQS
jgi:transcriptional regulator with PAS, ATPase and Fis domain